jgi:acetate kinase
MSTEKTTAPREEIERKALPDAYRSAMLIVNAGSSSLKYKLFHGGVEVLAGHLTGIGGSGVSTVSVRGQRTSVPRVTHDVSEAVAFALEVVSTQCPRERIGYVVHRVVHGGETLIHHTIITPEVEAEIERLAALAPLHNPAALAGIRLARKAIPGAVSVACFDTAFHHTIPRYAFLYGLPYRLYEEYGIRKYGFHGLSHEYAAQKAYEITRRSDRVITCHLGSGSSLCAVHHGRSRDTTMGFTPLDGLLMATRSGELDPTIPLVLIRDHGLSVEQVESLLTNDSGLKGIAGTGDLRAVKERADAGDEHAQVAIEMLCYRIALHIGAYSVTLGGVHTITFSGGIGENAAWVRERVCELLAPLGVLLDAEANEQHARTISSPTSRVTVLVVPADEERHMNDVVLGGRFVRPEPPSTFLNSSRFDNGSRETWRKKRTLEEIPGKKPEEILEVYEPSAQELFSNEGLARR